MVVGIEKFREFFAGHETQYAIIGGAACDLLFTEAGLGFRATKDIDLVLCVEAVDVELGQAFRRFIEAGGYQVRERSEGKKEFHRFLKPTDASFPFMIELFARRPGLLPEAFELARIPVDEDVISLSAILLDDAYYQALQTAKRVVAGVTIIDERLLIPFKAHAFLDLSKRDAAGQRIDSKNIKKHRNDVFRLVQLLSPDRPVEIADSIRDTLREFIVKVEAEAPINLKDLAVTLTRDEAIALLRTVYRLG